jgi:hypothetical protein
MREERPYTFSRLPTPAKILLIISLALLPIGLASAWSAKRGLDIANRASEGRSRDQALVANEAMSALIARNTLAVRLAANAALAGGNANACEEARRILAISPAVSREFTLSDPNGEPACTVGSVTPSRNVQVAPGDFRLWISPTLDAIYVRAGVMGGAGTQSAIRTLRRPESLWPPMAKSWWSFRPEDIAGSFWSAFHWPPTSFRPGCWSTGCR